LDATQPEQLMRRYKMIAQSIVTNMLCYVRD